MFRFLIFCFILLIPKAYFCQELRNIDSLIKLTHTNVFDTSYVKNLNLISKKYLIAGNFQEGRRFAQLAKDKSIQINYKKGIIKAYINFSWIFSYTSNYDSALLTLNNALQISDTVLDKKELATIYNNFGSNHLHKGNYKSALSFYLKALKINEEIKDKKGIAFCVNNVGIIYYKEKQFDKSLENYLRALKLFEEIGDNESFAKSYNNIGIVYNNKNNYDSALFYLLKSIELHEKIDDKSGLVNALISTGDLYASKKKYVEVLKNFKRALIISQEINDKRHEAHCLLNLGYFHYTLENIAESENYLNRALKLALEIGSKEMAHNAYKTLSQLLEKKGDYKQALVYQKLYTTINDSLFNIESNRQIAEMNSKYETEKKQTEIELLTNEKKLKEREITIRNLIIIGVTLLSILALIIYNRYNLKQKLLAEKQKLVLDNQLLELEQKLLRLQMNPHFIFNALTALQGLINSDKKREANIYLSKISKLIRTILENSREEFVVFEKEIQSLENYLYVNQLLMDYQFDYKIEVGEDIDVEQTFLPPMLTQPFIENTLKHGFKDKKDKGLIIIRFKTKDNIIVFEVEDNGNGLADNINKESSHQSLATIITKERLANLFRIPLVNILINSVEIKDSLGFVCGLITTFEIPVKKI